MKKEKISAINKFKNSFSKLFAFSKKQKNSNLEAQDMLLNCEEGIPCNDKARRCPALIKDSCGLNPAWNKKATTAAKEEMAS